MNGITTRYKITGADSVLIIHFQVLVAGTVAEVASIDVQSLVSLYSFVVEYDYADFLCVAFGILFDQH